MKKDWSKLEQFRVHPPRFESKVGERWGVFIIPLNPRYKLFCIVDCGEDYHGRPPSTTGWEHVSAHGEEHQCSGGFKQRTPSWGMMQQLKEIFWDDDETVVQFHPRRSDYVNRHPNTLHLWKCSSVEFPCPPLIMV